MPAEPAIKRTVAFIDGQNLFYAAKNADYLGVPVDGSYKPDHYRY